MQNGDNVTSYKNTVGTIPESFTFSTLQETIVLSNKGSKNINYVIGSNTGVLTPSTSVTVTGSFDSLVLNAEQGTQAFEIWADEVGTTGVSNGAITTLDGKVNALSAQLSQMATNVKLFGAKGDGVTDDTKAFNDAINSLPNGGVVIVPYGLTYMIQGWVTGSVNDHPTGGVLLKSNITMIMHGVTLKVIPNNKDHYTCLNISNCQNVKIVGGTLLGERTQHTNSPTYGDFGDQWGYGVAIVGSSDIIIEDVRADNFTGDGFYVGADNTGLLSANVTFKDCIAHNNRRNGMSVTGLYTGTIENCTFRQSNGWLPEAGLDIEPNPGRTVDGLVIKDSKFLGNNSYGLLFGSINAATRSGQNCVVTNNVARYNKSSGFYINKGWNNTISDNQSFENDENGIVIYESHYNTVEGNKAHLNKMHGFSIGFAEGNNILGNHATSNGQLTDQTYDQFTLFSSHRNNLQSNVARHVNLTKKARYGMYLTSDCDNNLVMNNDLAASGFFAGLNNASTTTRKGAGNRGNDFASWGTGDFI